MDSQPTQAGGDYLAQLAARRVNAPANIDALSRLEGWLKKSANAASRNDDLIVRLLAAVTPSMIKKFGDPADRNYEYPPEIVAAFKDSCERRGVREAGDTLSAIHDEMKQLANAINAAPVTSIEGLRVKALVAFWEVAPSCAGDTEFSFDDAYPFQQLFTAVAEVCGLKDKIAATGCTLPDRAGLRRRR